MGDLTALFFINQSRKTTIHPDSNRHDNKNYKSNKIGLTKELFFLMVYEVKLFAVYFNYFPLFQIY